MKITVRSTKSILKLSGADYNHWNAPLKDVDGKYTHVFEIEDFDEVTIE